MLAAALAGASFSCYSAIRSCALFGLKAANFHASSACHEKRADKFGTCQRGDRGHSYKGYGHKAYLNYMKRKKRAAEKRDLLKWRSCEIHISNFEELYWSCGNYRKWLNRNNRDGYEYTCYEKRSWSKKEKKSAQPKQGTARKRAFKEEFNFFWQRPGFSPFWDDMFSDHYGFAYNFYSGKDRRNNFSKNDSNCSGSSTRSSTGSSSEDQYSEKKNAKEQPTVGSPLDRKILGLPSSGFLSIEELKKAFRAAALRWHPDRHEASAKVAAEAKFKECGAAYKSLLAALLAKS